MKFDEQRLSVLEGIVSEMLTTYQKKNSDYGNSFAELRKRRPDAILVRIYDKYMRLEKLIELEQNKENPKVLDESIEDTLLDGALYLLLELVERRMPNERCEG